MNNITDEQKQLHLDITNELLKIQPGTCVSIYAKIVEYHEQKQLFRLDALYKEDYPHRIDDNSVYLTFEVDLEAHTIELWRYGNVWLSPSDLKTDRYKYLAMKSMINVLVDNGGKKMRKSKFKTAADAARKMTDYFSTVMTEVIRYTGGYPYKQGI